MELLEATKDKPLYLSRKIQRNTIIRDLNRLGIIEKTHGGIDSIYRSNWNISHYWLKNDIDSMRKVFVVCYQNKLLEKLFNSKYCTANLTFFEKLLENRDIQFRVLETLWTKGETVLTLEKVNGFIEEKERKLKSMKDYRKIFMSKNKQEVIIEN